jgi:hypothetical protein
MSMLRALGAGKEPIMPLRQAASTSSGPDTRNMGAATTGKRNCDLIASILSLLRTAVPLLSRPNE